MRFFRITLCVLSLTLMLSGCALLPKEAELPTMPTVSSEKSEFTYTYVQRGDLYKKQTYDVTYKSVKTEMLRFTLAGVRIDEVKIALGDTVKRGDVLMTLECESQEKAVRSAESKLSLLELEYSRLLEQKEEARRDYELQTRNLEEEELEKMDTMEEHLLSYTRAIEKKQDAITVQREVLASAREELKKRQLIAGISGTVIQLKTIKSGDVSSLTEIVATVSDTDSAMLVLESGTAEQFPEGRELSVTINGIDYPCVIISAREAGVAEDDVKKKVFLRCTEEVTELSNGDSGSLTLELSRKDDVLYVKKSAVSIMNGKSYVFVENENGIRTLQEVVTGYTNGSDIEIVSGLTEGQPVILQ